MIDKLKSVLIDKLKKLENEGRLKGEEKVITGLLGGKMDLVKEYSFKMVLP